MSFPASVSGRVELSHHGRPQEVLDQIAEHLRTKKGVEVDRVPAGGVRFSTGWPWSQSRSWQWVYLVERGEFSLHKSGDKVELRYALTRGMLALTTLLILVGAAAFATRGEFWARLVWVAGGWLFLVGGTHLIASMGVRSFLAGLVDPGPDR